MSISTYKEFTLSTGREGFYNITKEISAFLTESGIQEGIALVFCPHTTAAITINENCDPDVIFDLTKACNQFFPNLKEYRHMEGNSAAHFKSSIFSASLPVIVHEGRLVLGTWQGIYFCEFDGPRKRKYCVKILEG